MKPDPKHVASAARKLKAGGIGVLPTDTIYGLVGSALRKRTVARIYRIRRRRPNKPMIVLIADAQDVARFGVRITPFLATLFKGRWPGKVSVVVPCYSKKFTYLHHGERSLAFRVPKLKWLRDFLRETGPLVAPSANFQGMPAALTIKEARKNFGKRVDFYVDVGRRAGKPSKVIKVSGGKIIVLRK